MWNCSPSSLSFQPETPPPAIQPMQKHTHLLLCVYLSMQVPWRRNKDDKDGDWSLLLIYLFSPFLLLHSITFKATQNSVPFQLNNTCQILELEGSHRNRSKAWVPAGKQKMRAKASPLEGLMQWTFLFLNLSCCVNELGVTPAENVAWTESQSLQSGLNQNDLLDSASSTSLQLTTTPTEQQNKLKLNTQSNLSGIMKIREGFLMLGL